MIKQSIITKTLLAVFSLTLLFSHDLRAQNWKKTQEISLGYGTLSYPFLNIRNEKIKLTTSVNDKVKECKTTGVFLLSYRYFINDRFSLGAILGYEQSKGTTEIGYHWQRNNIMLLPEASFIYKEASNIKIYGEMAAGLSYVIDELDQGYSSLWPVHHSKITHPSVAFQISPVGVRYGNKIGGYAELGYGYKGIVNIGLSVKL